MISALKILAVAALWYIKSSSLPKFYFKLWILENIFKKFFWRFLSHKKRP